MLKNITILVLCICASTYSYPANSQGGSYYYKPPVGPRLELPVHNHMPARSQQRLMQQPIEQPQNYNRQRKSQQPYAALATTLNSQDYNTNSISADDDSNSDSVRLPLPLGVASINIAPLPLMEGSSYHGLTSYGTTYPQRI